MIMAMRTREWEKKVKKSTAKKTIEHSAIRAGQRRTREWKKRGLMSIARRTKQGKEYKARVILIFMKF